MRSSMESSRLSCSISFSSIQSLLSFLECGDLSPHSKSYCLSAANEMSPDDLGYTLSKALDKFINLRLHIIFVFSYFVICFIDCLHNRIVCSFRFFELSLLECDICDDYF